jgi:hypothetical protein
MDAGFAAEPPGTKMLNVVPLGLWACTFLENSLLPRSFIILHARCDNKKWFDIELLEDIGGSKQTFPIWNDKYGKHIKNILTKLGICANQLCHLGQKLGVKVLNLSLE